VSRIFESTEEFLAWLDDFEHLPDDDKTPPSE